MSEGITADVVYSVLQSTLSQDNQTRSAAEKQLKIWEDDSVPGFIGSLLKIAHEVVSVPEDIRLLAVVVAKNAVGSSWRKTVATREWSHVPEDEKEYIRSAALSLLLNDLSERVALQTGLLVTNIARFDVPRPWDSVVPGLLAAASLSENTVPIQHKSRALTALKYLLRALRSKRFVMGIDINTTTNIEAASLQVDRDRTKMFEQAKNLLGGLRREWEVNFSMLLQKADGWHEHGALAVAALACLRELLLLLTDLKDIELEFNALLQEGAQAGSAIVGPLFSGPAAPAASESTSDAYITLLSKCWERLLQIALVSMDRHTVSFAQHVPVWALLCINTALLGMDSAAVHGIRAKSRVLLTRFVARAMIQPLYRKESAAEEEQMIVLLPTAARAQMGTALPSLHAAAQCLDDMLSDQDGRCASLVQAIVSKYIILAPEELAEWEADPEGFARQVDVETSPDAETPRPCGVALLECMLERKEDTVASALVNLASACQSQQLTREGVYSREAVYRAVGECFTHLRTRVDFNVWYNGELRMMLMSQDLTGLEGSVVRARALWLVGVCGEELQPEPWAEAFTLTVQQMTNIDLVVALMAVSAVTALVATALEEQQFLAQPVEDQRVLLDSSGGLFGAINNNDSGLLNSEYATKEANKEFNAHLNAVETNLDTIMNNCFGLLPRLVEAESMVRVLQCVSATIELLGDKVRPHLQSITGALPRVWSVVQDNASEQGTGARVRLHSSLLAMLAHLVGKLGLPAVRDEGISGILLHLIQHATNVADPQAEPLLDDGLKLWMAVMRFTSDLTPQLLELVTSRLDGLLRNGKYNAEAFAIAEAYALHGGFAAIAPILPIITSGIATTLTNITEIMAPKPGRQPGSLTMSSLTPENAAEGSAALSLLSILQFICDPSLVHLEGPVRAAATMLCAEYGGGVMRLPARSVALMEKALEIVYRVLFANPGAASVMTGGDKSSADCFIDRWISLSLSRDVGELFIPAIGAGGRNRRHKAAVALCSLIVADALIYSLRDEHRAAHAIVLGLQAAREEKAFEADRQRILELKPEDPEHQDQLTVKKHLLIRNDPLRAVDAVDAARAAAGHVARWEGQERLVASVKAIEPVFGDYLATLLAGQLPEADTEAAVLSLQHANLS